MPDGGHAPIRVFVALITSQHLTIFVQQLQRKQLLVFIFLNLNIYIYKPIKTLIYTEKIGTCYNNILRVNVAYHNIVSNVKIIYVSSYTLSFSEEKFVGISKQKYFII